MPDKGHVMSQQSVRQAPRRSALDTQAVLRKERADRERRLGVWQSRCSPRSVNVMLSSRTLSGALRKRCGQ